MIFLFWDKDSISKNISWRSRTVLTSHKKKYKYFKLAKNLLPHHRMQMEIFGYMSRRIWICFLSSFFWGNCAAIHQKNANLYICIIWDVPMQVSCTTECWSNHHQKHINCEKTMAAWDSMVCFLREGTVVYTWTSFTWWYNSF